MKSVNPTYITFEQAKSLKKKDLKIDTEEVLFYRDEVNNIEEHQIKNREVIYNGGLTYKVDENEYRIYHQWELVEWLRINQDVWISVLECNDKSGFYWRILSLPGPSSATFNSPQEAYSAAFDYIIKHIN